MTTGESATEMTLGMMMENMKLVSKVDGGYGVIRGLLKYPEDKGWIRYITHGRRFELDDLTNSIRKGETNVKPGHRIQLEFLEGDEIAKRFSDIDKIAKDGVGESLKRQGKTLDAWAHEYSDEWLEAWMKSVTEGTGKSTIRFVIGGGEVAEKTKNRLKRLGDQLDITFEYKVRLLLPPPAIK